jgi:hypothetical protein
MPYPWLPGVIEWLFAVSTGAIWATSPLDLLRNPERR